MIGYEAKLYYDSTPLAGAPSTGTWTELTIVKDVTLNQEADEVDVTTRANSGFKSIAAGLKDAGVDLEVSWDPSDTAFAALQAAYKNRAEIAVAVMDGDIVTAGSDGLAGNWTVTNFTRNEPLGDDVTANITLKPSSYMAEYTAI